MEQELKQLDQKYWGIFSKHLGKWLQDYNGVVLHFQSKAVADAQLETERDKETDQEWEVREIGGTQ